MKKNILPGICLAILTFIYPAVRLFSQSPSLTSDQTETKIRIIDNESFRVGPGTKFDFHVRTLSEMDVTAVNLFLYLPPGISGVQDVTIPGSYIPVRFNLKDNQLQLSWNSQVPVILSAGDPLITLKLRSSDSLSESDTIRIRIRESPVNKIFSGKFSLIESTILKSDIAIGSTNISGETHDHELLMTIYPNPVKESATVNFSLPADGLVTIRIYNSIGTIVNDLLNEIKPGGKYSLNFDASTLPHGIYIAKITLHGNGFDQFHVFRFVVNK